MRSFTIQASAEGYKSALAAARSLDGEVIWGLESTGCYASAFARTLLENGCIVYEVPGSYTKRHRQRSSRAGKSDPLDAQAIAEAVLLEAERLPRYQVSPEREALRMRYDQRDRLVQQRTETVNRLRSAVLRLNRDDLPSEIASTKGISAVEDIIARSQTSHDLVVQAFVDDLRFAIEDIKRLNARIKELEAKLRPIVRRLAPELVDVCGVSTIVTAGLIGHAGDLSNCRNADAFAVRAGTAPVHCSTRRCSTESWRKSSTESVAACHRAGSDEQTRPAWPTIL